MRIVMVCASKIEAAAVQKAVNEVSDKQISVEILRTGPSIPFTVYAFGKFLSENPKADLYINTGICGSFRSHLSVGTVVDVCEDRFADVEIRFENHAKDLFEVGFWNSDKPFTDGWLLNKHPIPAGLAQVRGITVNATSGESRQIAERIRRFNPDTESMEGAAFAYVCENEKLPYLQIRAISNTIDKRSKQKWDIDLALSNLQNILIQLIREIN